MSVRDANLLAEQKQPEDQNVWLARAEAVLVPMAREARDEAYEAVRAFLRATATSGDSPKVSPEDVYPFRTIAASDGIDSYYTAQDVAKSLVPMAKDFAAGRSILGNHDYGTFSYGSTTSGRVVDAVPDAPEYEAAFYPDVLKAHPDRATKKWLQTDAYVVRGMNDMGGQASSDSLIRGMEMGAIRRVSISFTVGGYRCGIDGQDMLAGWFGDPEPAGMWDDKATCMHFPGIDYGKEGVGFAVMENNRALEESMVYMNSSPSAMLMRKARAMAERGVLTPVQRVIVEQKFRTVLPTFGRRVWTIAPREPSKEVVMATRTIAVGDKVRWTESEKEREGTVHAIDDEGRLTITTIDDEGAIRDVEVDGVDALDPEEAEEAEMTGHEAAAGAEARAAAPSTAADLTAHLTGKEPAGHAADVPDGTALPELVSLHEDLHKSKTGHEHASAASAEPIIEAAIEPDEARSKQPTPANATELQAHLTAAEPNGHGAAASGSGEDLKAMHDNLHSSDSPQCGHSHGGSSSASPEPDVQGPVELVALGELEPTAENVTEEFVIAAQRLVSFAVRTPEAFGSRETSAIYAAERTIEQSLVDLGVERSVGADVVRQYTARDKILREVLGSDLTVETMRRLKEKEVIADEAKSELVRDTVAARVGVHGERFDAEAYGNMLRTQSMATIRSERDAWEEAKRQRFTPGRSVVPRDIKDGKVEKRAPARPAVASGESAAGEQSNLLADR
jgi:plastocyanin